jgi:hypothetical protein
MKLLAQQQGGFLSLKNDNAFGWVTQTAQRRPTSNQHSCIIQKKEEISMNVSETTQFERIDPIADHVRLCYAYVRLNLRHNANAWIVQGPVRICSEQTVKLLFFPDKKNCQSNACNKVVAGMGSCCYSACATHSRSKTHGCMLLILSATTLSFNFGDGQQKRRSCR